MTAVDLPPLDRGHPLYRGWWDGLDEDEVRLRHCCGCGRRQWPPRPVCVHCGEAEFVWKPGPSEGIVHTFTRMRRAFHPAFAERVPVVLVVVEVDVGVRLLGELLDADPEISPIGRRVGARFVSRPSVGRLLAWRGCGRAGGE